MVLSSNGLMDVGKKMDFSDKPIIVLGANHSGTRVLVEILSALGSDGGDYDNQWRENKFFLTLHQQMVDMSSERDWSGKIFGLDFVKDIKLEEDKKAAVRELIRRDLGQAYPMHESRPWHWKCPTSALFMDFWLETYPDAYYIHISRDPLDVAQSLISRRQFYTVRSALKFHELMEAKLARAASAKHYLKVEYERLGPELSRLVEFMPFLDAGGLAEAGGLIYEPKLHWKHNRSLKFNLWNMATAARVAAAKTFRSLGMGS